jgi:D-2-hydroxyacid dehydrogenase (NADP+)
MPGRVPGSFQNINSCDKVLHMGTLLFGADSLADGEIREIGELTGMRVVVTADRQEMESHLEDTEIAVRSVPTGLLERAPRLRWYQNWFAGVEHLVGLEVFSSGRAVLTNASGVHAEPMANQFFGMLLSSARNLPFHWDAQHGHEWSHRTMADVWELDGRTLVIAGYGAIGRRVGEIAAAFGMRVYGVRRKPSPEAVLERGIEELRALCSEADVVLNLLPLTPATEQLFNEDLFSACKPGAVFSNFGRGRHVDQAALLRALDQGQISLALLDVTDPEPLPPDSPLWAHRRVMITPHTGGWTDRYHERTWPLFSENLRRFIAGKRLINVIDTVAGY